MGFIWFVLQTHAQGPWLLLHRSHRYVQYSGYRRHQAALYGNGEDDNDNGDAVEALRIGFMSGDEIAPQENGHGTLQARKQDESPARFSSTVPG